MLAAKALRKHKPMFAGLFLSLVSLQLMAFPSPFSDQKLIAGPKVAAPYWVHAADFDGDGDLDIVAALRTDQKVVWYENQGGDQYGRQAVIAASAGEVYSVFAADLDGDGDQDVLSASGAGINRVAWYENDGAGNFSSPHVISTAVGAFSVYAFDLDGDGTKDVLLAANKIAWHRNDGAGAFGAEQVIDTAPATSVYVADLDHDGDRDVLASFADETVSWYENDGAGNFSAEQVLITSTGGGLSVFAADLDGDGDEDVLYSSSVDNKIGWLRNDTGGNFSGGAFITSALNGVLSVFAADLDGDNDLDVLSASFSDRKIAWYENDGAGNFGGQNIISTTANGARTVYAADLDGDNDVDVLSTSVNDNKIAWYENDGAANFAAPSRVSNIVDGARAVYAADLDGDGQKDVLSASSNDNKIAWYRNDGAADFGTQQVISLLTDSPSSIFSADLDGDGDQDVLSASISDDKIAWYENDGAGNFGLQQPISLGADSANSVFAIDLDGDGDLDVLSASGNDDKIAWYENDGFGSFDGEQIITAQADLAFSVYAADLDGDGDNDVLSGSFLDDKIAWYENDGAGNFGPQQVISLLADGALSVFAADLDGDGDVDVLSTSFSDDKVAWYANDGAGNFGSQQVISMDVDRPYSVSAIDLDGDGDKDVLTALAGDDKIAWYENDGSGNFGNQQVISTDADFAFSAFACDLDGDGDEDVLSASSGDGKIAWYENELPARDFGDAPDPDYPTLIQSAGARHLIRNNLFFGTLVDGEIDGQPNATATGDDLADSADEDGISFNGLVIGNANASVDVSVSQAGLGIVNAWADLDQSGTWEVTEQIITNELIETTSETINFGIPSDATPGNTFFRFRVSSAGGDNVDGQSDDGEVQDYQQALLLPTISIDDVSQSEGDTDTSNMSFTVTLSQAVSHAVDFEYSTTAGTASAGADFVAASNAPASIPAGSLSTQVNIPIMGETVFEADEGFTVSLSNPSGASIGDGSGAGTIENDDSRPTVGLTLDNSNIAENAGVASFTATLSNPSTETLTVDLVLSGTATAGGVDYNASATSIVIAPLATSGSMSVTALNDPLDEIDESIIVDIAVVTNGSEDGVQQQTTIIADDDVPPTITLAVDDDSIAENGGVATLTATLNTASSLPVTVNLGFSGTATGGGTDYNASGNQIVIAAGNLSGNITQTAVDDSLVENDETIITDITSVANGTENGTQQVTVTIEDDDVVAVQPVASVSDVTLDEGDSGNTVFSFNVTLDKASSETINLHVDTVSQTASETSDFQDISTDISFTPGVTSIAVDVNVFGDTEVEEDEVFRLNISNRDLSPVGIAKSNGIGTIVNDDTPLAGPELVLEQVSLDFGIVNSGDTSSRTLQISNDGDAELIVVNLNITGANADRFSIASSNCEIIPADGSCHVAMDFAPTVEGGFTATLNFNSNDPDTPSSQVPLAGTGGDDEDGATNAEEDAVPNPDGGENCDPSGTGDGNCDGIPDSEQDNVTSHPTLNGGGYVTVVSEAGTKLRGVTTDVQPDSDDLSNFVFPIGFFGFQLDNLAPGTCTVVTVILDDNASAPFGGSPADFYFKYGPTPSTPTDHYYRFSYNSTTGAEDTTVNGQPAINLHFCDGRRGDHDLTANGSIEDPGGPATSTASSTGGSAGGSGSSGDDDDDDGNWYGGCSLSAKPAAFDPTLFLLLVTSLAWLVSRGQRLKRK